MRSQCLCLIVPFLFSVACGETPAPVEAGSTAEKERLPNIVILLPDDLGHDDVSFESGDIATPNIDRIAKEGVTLERFYSAPVCSPTRAGLMTGRYPIRFGLMRAVIPPWRDYGMDTSEVTLPEVLAKAGYEHRGIFGKWHLGHTSIRYHPMRRGFTEFVGHLNGGIAYFSHLRNGELDWRHDYETVEEEGYATDLTAEYAVRFINAHADDTTPFLCYVPFNAPHGPIEAKEEDLPLYADLPALEEPRSWEESTAGRPLPPVESRRDTRRVIGSAVHALDVGIGRILQALEDNGIADNTLVLFFSDNGGSVAVSDNGAFRGAKGSVFEGGIRVAAAARWPEGKITGGGTISTPMTYIDVLPTLMAIAGISDHGGKALDGTDVSKVLDGSNPTLDRDLYSFIAQLDPEREQVAVLEPEWKLVTIGQPLTRPGSAETSRKLLFRIDEDPYEEHDLAAENPEQVARLLEKAIAFRSLQPPNPVPPFRVGQEGFKPPPRWQYPDS